MAWSFFCWLFFTCFHTLWSPFYLIMSTISQTCWSTMTVSFSSHNKWELSFSFLFAIYDNFHMFLMHFPHSYVLSLSWQDNLVQQTFRKLISLPHWQDMKTETKFILHVEYYPDPNPLVTAEIICWVSESAQPYNIVNNCSFQTLMKMGQPGYYLPSPSTVTHDVQMVFVCTCQKIANMLWVCKDFILSPQRTHWTQGIQRWPEFHNRCVDFPWP